MRRAGALCVALSVAGACGGGTARDAAPDLRSPEAPPVSSTAAPPAAVPHLQSAPPVAPPAPTLAGVVVAVSMTIQPGKPGAPSEVVRASRNAAGATRLAISRRGEEAKILAEEEVDLPADAFAALVRLVDERGLSAFVPREAEGEIFDFGSRTLSVERISATGAPDVHEITWSRPLQDEAGVDEMRHRLGALASQHGKRVTLAYFPEK